MNIYVVHVYTTLPAVRIHSLLMHAPKHIPTRTLTHPLTHTRPCSTQTGGSSFRKRHGPCLEQAQHGRVCAVAKAQNEGTHLLGWTPLVQLFFARILVRVEMADQAVLIIMYVCMCVFSRHVFVHVQLNVCACMYLNPQKSSHA